MWLRTYFELNFHHERNIYVILKEICIFSFIILVELFLS